MRWLTKMEEIWLEVPRKWYVNREKKRSWKMQLWSHGKGNQHLMTSRIDHDISMGKICKPWESLKRRKTLNNWISWRCVNMYAKCWYYNKQMSWWRTITKVNFVWCSFFIFEHVWMGLYRAIERELWMSPTTSTHVVDPEGRMMWKR